MVTAKPSPDLVELSKQWYEAYRKGDESFGPEHIGHGEVAMFGSAPEDEKFLGRDSVLSLTIARSKEINREAGLSTDLDPELQIEAWEAGDTGWAVTHMNVRDAEGGAVLTRMVNVFARDEDGSWKAVFGAGHVLVPNDALRPDSPAYPALSEASAARST